MCGRSLFKNLPYSNSNSSCSKYTQYIFVNTNLCESLTFNRVNSENMRILLPIQCCQILLFCAFELVCFSLFHLFRRQCLRFRRHFFFIIIFILFPYPTAIFTFVRCTSFLYSFPNTLFTHLLLLLLRFVRPSSLCTPELVLVCLRP